MQSVPRFQPVAEVCMYDGEPEIDAFMTAGLDCLTSVCHCMAVYGDGKSMKRSVLSYKARTYYPDAWSGMTKMVITLKRTNRIISNIPSISRKKPWLL